MQQAFAKIEGVAMNRVTAGEAFSFTYNTPLAN